MTASIFNWLFQHFKLNIHFHSKRLNSKGGGLDHRWIFGLLILCILTFFYSCASRHQSRDGSTQHPIITANISPEQQLKAGINAYAKGDLGQANNLFTTAAIGYEKKGDRVGQCNSILRSAHTCLSSGHTDQAAVYLEAAEKIAATVESQKIHGQIHSLWGNLYHIIGRPQAALKSMEKAISIAKEFGYKKQLASIQNDLGNLYGSLKQYPKALEAYRISATLGKKNGELSDSAVALTNAAMILITMGDQYLKFPKERYASVKSMEKISHSTRVRGTLLFNDNIQQNKEFHDPQKAIAHFNEAAGLLDEARAVLKTPDISQHKITTQINIGLAFLDLAERDPNQAGQHLDSASEEFYRAVELAGNIQNNRLASYAGGNLGLLLQKEGKIDQSIDRTREAIYRAHKAGTPESLYRWQWQYAHLLTIQNQMPAAISAYEEAIFTIEAIRGEFSNCYGLPRAELRKATDKLYLEYVDALLKVVDKSDPKEQQGILEKARETIEKRRVFELRDYFNDDCLGSSTIEATNVDELTQTAVVIYPVILPDRLEIIATFPSITVQNPDGAAIDSKTATRRHYITNVNSETLIKEVKSFRQSLEIVNTSAQYLNHSKKLYDWLIRPLKEELIRSEVDTLVFIPDDTLRNIPMGALWDGSAFLIQSYAVAVTPGLVLTNPTPLHPDKINILAVGITEAYKGFEALPGVAHELEAIASLYDTKVLINKQFSLANFKQALYGGNYNVIHIASHGKFRDEIEESFMLAYDTQLTFNDLSDFVGLYRFRKTPLELLTLSACETAAGNKKAALGMAGIAVKVGARSALATLWSVDDYAAAKLVSEFYRQLRKPDVSRAMALRQAQQQLIDNSNFNHPGYWSPFILINNWL